MYESVLSAAEPPAKKMAEYSLFDLRLALLCYLFYKVLFH